MRDPRSTLLLICAALLLLAPFATATEVLTPEQLAKKAASKLRKAYQNKNPKARCNALLEASLTQHELVAREIGKALRRERNPSVVEAGAMVLGDMKSVALDAGAVLKAQIRARRKQPKAAEMLRALVRSIGKLRYTGAHDELMPLLDHAEPWVVVATIQTLGEVGDRKALPRLYKMAASTGDFYVEATREATGTPRPMADRDRQRADRKAGAGQSRRVYAEIVKLYMRHLRDTVKKLTGEEFRSLAEFKAWLDEHPEEIGRKKTRKTPGRGR
jgi:hypothetical protein